MTIERISYHGGHSGQYCTHAEDRLEEIVARYIELGFKTVGITEHIPPPEDRLCYSDEKALNLTAAYLLNRFEAYIQELTRLKLKYADRITLYIGMETETTTGYAAHVNNLIQRFNPDYIVGSVHHIDDVCFDFSRQAYDSLVADFGGHEALYERYFDIQLDMIKTLKPFIVGHFDLIRIYDDDYENRILTPAIDQKINRNLACIKSLNLVMDFNLRPLAKGKKEPYITDSILKKVLKLGIQAVPGDDSHSAAQAGLNVDKAIEILTRHGFDTCWPTPRLLS